MDLSLSSTTISEILRQIYGKVCADVETEPQLQPLNGEIINVLIGDNWKPDIRAGGI